MYEIFNKFSNFFLQHFFNMAMPFEGFQYYLH